MNTPDLIARFYLAVQFVDDPANSDHDINIWLVNDTEQDLTYTVRSGEFTTVDDGLLQSSIAVKPAEGISAGSAIVFEEEFDWGLDFVVWWHVDVTDADGVTHHLGATRGKYGWSNSDDYVDIPFTGTRGKLLPFTARG